MKNINTRTKCTDRANRLNENKENLGDNQGINKRGKRDYKKNRKQELNKNTKQESEQTEETHNTCKKSAFTFTSAPSCLNGQNPKLQAYFYCMQPNNRRQRGPQSAYYDKGDPRGEWKNALNCAL